MGKKKEKRAMSITHPALAVEFRYVVGKPDATAENTVAGTNAKVGWACSACSHTWEATGGSRVNKGSGCRKCAQRLRGEKRSIPTSGKALSDNMELSVDFDLKRNPDVDPSRIYAGTNEKVWWICRGSDACGHSWKATGGSRLNQGSGCPACAGIVVKPDGSNAIAAQPYGKEFQHVVGKPDRTAKNTVAGTSLMVSWLCGKPGCGHVWVDSGHNRCKERGCSACSGRSLRPDGSNSVAAKTYGSEFVCVLDDPEATVSSTIAGTMSRIRWECSEPSCKKIWVATGNNRSTKGRGCPRCNRTYSASEHISNTYLVLLLPAHNFNVDIGIGKASLIHNPEGNPFQVDARIHTPFGTIAYLYDGMGGHRDDDASRSSDIRRRKALCSNVSFVVAHRHGMQEIERGVAAPNYLDVVSVKSASIFSGTRQVLQALDPSFASRNVDFESIFVEASRSWCSLPKANRLKFESVLSRERKALQQEGYIGVRAAA